MKPLYGLILCGGQSSRMKDDKSLLDYHGQPQRYYLYDLLRPNCDRVFICCNQQQVESIPSQHECIVDEEKYSGIGPMAALLSAFEKFPDASFLVVGCDYPFLTAQYIRNLVREERESADAVCYCHPETEMCEPLIGIYANSSYQKLLRNFKEERYSLRHFLEEGNTCKIIPSSAGFLKSVDDVASYQQAKEAIQSKRVRK